jgi:hypothetical protein
LNFINFKGDHFASIDPSRTPIGGTYGCSTVPYTSNYHTVHLQTHSHFLAPQYVHSTRLWKLLQTPLDSSTKLDLFHITLQRAENSIQKIKFSSKSFLHQIIHPPLNKRGPNSNRFTIFYEDSEITLSQMKTKNPSEQPQGISSDTSPPSKQAWSNDTTVSALSDEIFQHLQKHQQTIQDAGEIDEDAHRYKQPDHVIKPTTKLSQRIRFNLVRHCGTISDIPTLKLFKSFTATLRNADPTLVILPYQAAKQHYSSLTNLKQIQANNDQHLLQFFKPYYQKQQYSLSGFLHDVSSTLSFDQLCSLPSIDEWLDTYNYFMKLCLSQSKEMTQIGALYYSNLFMYREDLKVAILDHPLWSPTDPTNPPIFDLFLNNFIFNRKKFKMTFVSAEQSKSKETVDLFKKLYDGSPKAYPNGYMMLFIPPIDGHQPSSKFRAKILFNHLQFQGEDAAFSIGGFQDLKNMIKPCNGNTVSLCTLIKRIPASNGMSCPQLFQHVEPNISGIVTMVTFQKQDSPLVYA